MSAKKLLFLGAFVFFSGANGNGVCVSMPGVLRCSAGFVEEFPKGSFGTVTLSGTHVKNTVRVSAGFFSAEKSDLNSIDFSAGKSTFKDSRLKGNQLKIAAGHVDFDKTNVEHDIEIFSPDVVLEDSVFRNIVIPTTPQSKDVIMRIKGRSLVKGSITFTGGNGKVCIENNSKVNGRIMGAQIITSDC